MKVKFLLSLYKNILVILRFLSFYKNILVVLLLASSATAQNPKTDSLLALLETDKPDTNKVNHLNALVNQYISSEPKKALEYAQLALSLAQKIKWDKGVANSFHSVGYYYFTQGDYPNTLNYWLKALKMTEKLGDKKGIAASFGNIGSVYLYQADYSKALDYYFRALKMKKKLRDKNGIANTFSNIGIVYSEQADYTKALDYYFSALKMAESASDGGYKQFQANTLGNIGIVYKEQVDYPKALNYYLRALEMKEELGDKKGIASTLGNIGVVYMNQANYPKALDFYFKTLKMAEELGYKQLQANTLGSIGNVYTEQADLSRERGDNTQTKRNYAKIHPVELDTLRNRALDFYFRALKMEEELGNKNGMAIRLGSIGSLYTTKVGETKDEGQKKKLFADAEKYLLAALKIDKEIGAQNVERHVEGALSKLYEESNRPLLALEHYKKAMALKDTIFNDEKSKDIGKLEAKHEYAMTELKRKQRQLQLQRQEEAAVDRRNHLQYSGIGLGIIILFVGIFLVARKFKTIQSEKIYRRYVKINEITLFISFLIFFEFISVLLDPFKEQLTGGAPLWKLLLNAVLAGAIFPIHNFLERKLKGGVVNAGRREDGETGEREDGGTGERENEETGKREDGKTGERGTGNTAKNYLLFVGMAVVMGMNYGFDSKNVVNPSFVRVNSVEPSQIVNRKSQTSGERSRTIVNSKFDSLKSVLETRCSVSLHKHDTICVNTLNALGWEFKDTNPDTSILLSQQALSISEKIKWQKGIGNSYHYLAVINMLKGNDKLSIEFGHKAISKRKILHNRRDLAATLRIIGIAYRNQSDYLKAIDYFYKAIFIAKALGDKSILADNNLSIGNIYLDQANFPKALQFFFDALKTFKELGKKQGIAITLGNIGIIYKEQSDYPKALDYFFRALEFEEKRGNKKGMAGHLGNIGIVYKEQSNFAKAIDYYSRALKIDEELGDKKGMAYRLGYLGSAYMEQSDFPRAIDYYLRALKLTQELGNKMLIANWFGNIGSLYTKTGEYKNAEKYLSDASKIAKEIGAEKQEMDVEKYFTTLYEKTNRPSLALEHYKKAMALKDTIFNEEKSKDIGKLEARHEYEMTELKRKQRQEQEAVAVAVAVSRRNMLQYSGIVIGLMILFISILLTARKFKKIFAISGSAFGGTNEKFHLQYLKIMEGTLFISFLIFFEFVLVLLDPSIEQFTGGVPLYKLLVNVALAGIIFPIHNFLESRIKGGMVIGH